MQLRWFPGPDGEHWPDWSGKAPVEESRVCYVTATHEGVKQAIACEQLRGEESELVERFQRSAEKEFVKWLGLANRASRAAVGQRAVKHSFVSNRARLLLISDDAGGSAQRKYGEQARRKQVSCIYIRSGRQLGQPLGREFVSTAAITGETFVERILAATFALWPGNGVGRLISAAKIELETATDTR